MRVACGSWGKPLHQNSESTQTTSISTRRVSSVQEDHSLTMAFATRMWCVLLLFLLLLNRSMLVAHLVLPSTCNTVNGTNFGARLDLYYLYLLEYDLNITSIIDLARIDQAIATALVESLDDCDKDDRPMYGVLLAEHDEFSQEGDGSCEPLSENTTCRVTRGITSVLLDGDVVRAQNVSLTVIDQVLADTQFLMDYTGIPLLRSEFMRSIGENIILLEEGSTAAIGESQSAAQPTNGRSKLKIALSVAAVVLFAVVVFFVGLFCKHRVRLGHYQAKRRRYFHQLQEQENRWMTVDGNPEDIEDFEGISSPKQRLAWSISDLTSDAESIRSSLPMDRIAEEGSSYQTDEEVPTNEDNEALDAHLKFIAHWKDPMEGDDSDDGNIHMLQQQTGEDEEVTPIRRNHLEEFDSAVDQGILHGCLYLDLDEHESSPDLDASNDTDPTTEALPQLPPYLFKAPVSMSLSEDEGEEEDRLLHMPSDEFSWQRLLLIEQQHISMSKNAEPFRDDALRDSQVFRPKQIQESVQQDAPVSTDKRITQDESWRKENQQPMHNYHGPFVEPGESNENNQDVSSDEATLLLKSWAESVLQNIALSQTQKRIGI